MRYSSLKIAGHYSLDRGIPYPKGHDSFLELCNGLGLVQENSIWLYREERFKQCPAIEYAEYHIKISLCELCVHSKYIGQT